MNAILWPVFNYVAKNRWAQIALGLGIFWLLFMAYLAMRDSGIRRVEREKAKAARAEENRVERERIIETVTEIGQETEDAKDRAIAAPRHVDDVSNADELRERYPDNAAIILRPSPPSSRKGPR